MNTFSVEDYLAIFPLPASVGPDGTMASVMDMQAYPPYMHDIPPQTALQPTYMAPEYMSAISLPNEDSFEIAMWNRYNKYAAQDDGMDLQPQFSQCSLPDFPMSSTGFTSPGLGSIDAQFSPSDSVQSPATDITVSSYSSQEQTRGRPRRKSRIESSSSASASDRKPTTAIQEVERKKKVVSTPLPAESPTSSASKSAPTSHKRERNRVSARKCRQRTKSKLSELEDQAEDMQEQHETLLAEIKDLQYELIATQVECMKHIHCRCAEVKQAMSQPSSASVEAGSRIEVTT